MKQILISVLVSMSALISYQASARCTNVSGNPSADAYCSILQPSICKPEYTGGQCMDVVMGRCTNVGGDPNDNIYCSIIQADICKPEYTGGKCMLIVN